MFRDLKEYQDIAKIYTEKVSKSENLKEQIVGSMPAKTAGSGNVRGSGVQKKLNPGKVTPQSQIRKIDPAPFNRSAASVTRTPSGDNLKAGSFGISKAGQQQAAANKAEFKAKADAVKASSTTQSKPKVSNLTRQGKERTPAQMAAAKRIASGKTIADVKAANTKSMQDRARANNQKFQAAKKEGPEALKKFRDSKLTGRERAQQMAKARIAAKNKPIEKKEPTTTPIGKPMPSNFPGGVSGKGKETDDFSKDPKYQSTAGKSTDIKQSSGSNKRAEAAKRRREMQNNQKNIKKKEAFENNPRVKNFRKNVQDLKTTAKYGSTATIQTQDGKEFKPGDPGYEAELKKARSMVQKSMQRNSYEPDMDAYDMVLEYLLSTEQVATIEEANYVMMQLDEEYIQEVVGTVAKLGLKGLKAVGKFGAKSPLHFGGTIAATTALAPSVGKVSIKQRRHLAILLIRLQTLIL